MNWRILALLGAGWLFWLPATAQEPSVLMNELFYDAPASDAGNEWIELVNVRDTPVNLAGWKIQRGGTSFTTVFTFPDGAVINPWQRLLVGESNVPGVAFTASLTFQNGGEASDGVRLVAPDGSVPDVLLYDEPNTNGLPDASGAAGSVFAPDVQEGRSLARIPDGQHAGGDSRDFSDTGSPTPGAANAQSSPEATPAATPGPTVTPSPSPRSSPIPNTVSAARVVVSEVFPNPTGDDRDGEFVELFNDGSGTADLTGFSLDDGDGGSTPAALPAGITIPPGGYRSFSGRETRLVFNNDADRARLLRPDGTRQHELVYERIPGEGFAYARRPDGTAAWTKTPTPGRANVFPVESTAARSAVPRASASPRSQSSPMVKGATGVSPAGAPRVASPQPRGTQPAPASPSAHTGEAATPRAAARPSLPREQTLPGASSPAPLSIADARRVPLGQSVLAHGVVVVPPRVFDPHLFYLGGSGIGVVLPEGSLPELVLGDTVIVRGVIAEIHHERVIALSRAEDIQRGERSAPPSPHDLKLRDVGESWEGSLVRVTGRVREKAEESLLLEDGVARLRVIAAPPASYGGTEFSVGQELLVSGIVSEDDDGYRLLPRGPADVRIQQGTRDVRPIWKRPLSIIALGCLAAAALFTAGKYRVGR